MRCALIDDDRLFHQDFKKAVAEYIDVGKIDCYFSAKQFISDIKHRELKYNVIFLDIDMPEMDGISLSKYLQKKELITPIIVFVTNKINLVYNAFGINVLAFIYKPELTNRIRDVLESADEILASNSFLSVPTSSGKQTIAIKDIMYIEYIDRKTVIVTKYTRIITNVTTLEEIKGRIDSRLFCYANRSVIVNISHASLIAKNNLIMNNDAVIEISRARKKEVENLYIKLRLN